MANVVVTATRVIVSFLTHEAIIAKMVGTTEAVIDLGLADLANHQIAVQGDPVPVQRMVGEEYAVY